MNAKTIISLVIVAMMVVPIAPLAGSVSGDNPAWADQAAGFTIETKQITQEQLDVLWPLDDLASSVIYDFGIKRYTDSGDAVFAFDYEFSNINTYEVYASSVHIYPLATGVKNTASMMDYDLVSYIFDLSVVCTVTKEGDGTDIINRDVDYVESGSSLTEKLGTTTYTEGDKLSISGHFEVNYFEEYTDVLRQYDGTKYWVLTESCVGGYADRCTGLDVTWEMANGNKSHFTGEAYYHDNSTSLYNICEEDRSTFKYGDETTWEYIGNQDYSEKSSNLYDDDGNRYVIEAMEPPTYRNEYTITMDDGCMLDLEDYASDDALLEYWFGGVGVSTFGTLTKGYGDAKAGYFIYREKIVNNEPYLYDAVNKAPEQQDNIIFYAVIAVLILVILALAAMYIRKK